MTPMIDVIFLLLIFFVCTSSFQPPEEVLPTNMTLPGSTAAPLPIDPLEEDLDEIVVKLFWQGGGPGWEINGQQYGRLEDIAGVLQAVAALKADLPVILDVAGGVPMEHVIDVCDVCRQIGLQQVRFAASAGGAG